MPEWPEPHRKPDRHRQKGSKKPGTLSLRRKAVAKTGLLQRIESITRSETGSKISRPPYPLMTWRRKRSTDGWNSSKNSPYTITQWTGHSSLTAMKPYMAIADKEKNKDKESIAKCDNQCQSNSQLSLVPIEKRIYVVRDTQVMIDLDLASLYDVENRSLRQAVRRNLDSFPDDFMFRLSQNEANDLIARGVSQSVIPPGYNTGGAEMYAFTEQGVAMLATVLKSPKARAERNRDPNKGLPNGHCPIHLQRGQRNVYHEQVIFRPGG